MHRGGAHADGCCSQRDCAALEGLAQAQVACARDAAPQVVAGREGVHDIDAPALEGARRCRGHGAVHGHHLRVERLWQARALL